MADRTIDINHTRVSDKGRRIAGKIRDGGEDEKTVGQRSAKFLDREVAEKHWEDTDDGDGRGDTFCNGAGPDLIVRERRHDESCDGGVSIDGEEEAKKPSRKGRREIPSCL